MCDLFEPERSFTEPLCSPTGSPALIQPQKTLENAMFFFIWMMKSWFLQINFYLLASCAL